jgi:molybdopterin-guanine dinucleotide biosynthesis protein B
MQLPGGIPMFGVTGASGSGKTTVLEVLVRVLKQRGWRVATLKHTPAGFTLDRPGKDSWRFARAGAEAVLLHSPGAWAVLGFPPHPLDPLRLGEALAAFYRALALPPPDLILVEGHHALDIPSIHVQGARGRAPGPRCLALVNGPQEAEHLADLVERTLGLTRPGQNPGSGGTAGAERGTREASQG